MDSVPGTGEDMVESDGQADPENFANASTAAQHQCELIQSMIEISISSLQGLRTKCATSNDLTQQEIRTLEVRLVNYIISQLECKKLVAPDERSPALESYPRLGDWLLAINLRPETIETVPAQLSLDALLQMSACQVQDTMKRLGSTSEECSHIAAALSCLKSTTERGGERREDEVSWVADPTRDDSISATPTDQLSTPACGPNAVLTPTVTMTPCNPPTGHIRSVSVSTVPSSDAADSNGDLFPFVRMGRISSSAATPPVTPPSRRRGLLRPPRTPPPPSRKLLAQLLPSITLTRSRSQEAQLANRIEEPSNMKKTRLPLNVHINGGGGSGSEDSPSRSPLLPINSPYILPATPGHVDEAAYRNNPDVLRISPQTMRRDFGLPVTHRFSTKSWLSQVCQVCQRNMMFGVKCKHCKLKCHNKCTKEAPACHLPFLQISKIRRTESVPSDINNQIDRTVEIPLFGTLPKAITKKDHPPALNQQMDSSSNPSSTTSSTPSSPAAFPQTSLHSATPPPNPSPKGARDIRFHFPAACYIHHRQQFIFPDVANASHAESYLNTGESELAEETQDAQLRSEQSEHEQDGNGEEQEEEESRRQDGTVEKRGSDSDGEPDEGDELDDLPSPRSGGQWHGPISRKASQTSVYLQEWDIPFEQLELGELIGKGRWGKVYRGRWHGEVAIRLLEIDGNNQDHLKLFKKEVMNYRQTRHENVILFMGACMNPPQLAIITSFCKGRTLYSVVRESKSMLDINKTRQIAQEIVKGMGYLHAKGIVHKDLKSKNIFYDTNKVVITDFGLFGMSGVVQEGRREDQLKLPHGWICYLAPEIVRRMGPGLNEDQLPFSKAADIYAFGTIWYELQARNWPITRQPAEATIWQVGSGEAVKKVIAEVSLGKEVTEILSACWSYCLELRPTFSQINDMLEKLPKLNRRLSHPGHFFKSADTWHHHCLRDHCSQGPRSRCPYN